MPDSPHAWYGCRADKLDANDFLTTFKTARLPAKYDLQQWCCPVMDQGPIGSCTAHGTTAAARWHIRKRGTTYDFDMSRLQLYHDSRAMEGTVASDSGAEIRDVIKVLAKRGVGREELWPYDVSKWKDAPPPEIYEDSMQYKALRYERVDVSVGGVMQALVNNHPVIIGISVYESFENDVGDNGVVPMPVIGHERCVGGHCMLVVGYELGHFIVQNSWGTDWGNGGFCYIPYAYIGSPKLGADYWVLKMFGSDAELAAGTA